MVMTLRDKKNYIIEMIEHELEVFNPLYDGDVELSEGMAYLYEDVKKFFLKENVTLDSLIKHLENKHTKLSLSKTTKQGYKDGIGLIKDLMERFEFDGNPISDLGFDSWGDFEFRKPVFVDGRDCPNEYDLVKWVHTEPREVIDGRTGKKKISTEYCYSIGKLVWDIDGQYFKFSSQGMRFLEDYEDGLNQFIIDFANKREDGHKIWEF